MTPSTLATAQIALDALLAGKTNPGRPTPSVRRKKATKKQVADEPINLDEIAKRIARSSKMSRKEEEARLSILELRAEKEARRKKGKKRKAKALEDRDEN